MSHRPSVCEWAENTWRLPSGDLIRLRPWQRAVLLAMFPADGSPSPHETFLISTVKKGGKTELNGVATLYAALTLPAPETLYCVANDAEQAQERVFDRIAGAVRRAGLVKAGAATVSKTSIEFPETGTRIVAIPADFAGAAGAVFGVTSWTELWAFRFEQHVRLWEELTPIPNRRSLRIIDSYAGFAGDAPVLEPMWQRAMAGVRLDDELPVYANGKLWAYIDQGDEAQARAWLGDPDSREAYYAEQSASLRPGTYRRLHENRWAEGEEAFIDAAMWDAVVDPDATPMLPDRSVRVTVGVDAAMKRDCSAVVAVTRDGDRVRVVAHKVWTPTKDRPLDFDETIAPYLAWLRDSFTVERVLFDPRMLEQPANVWRKEGVPMREFPQTPENLTRAGQGLFDLIRARQLVVYPDAELRQHALNAVAVETARGLRLAKEKASRKIDALAALSFACVDVTGRSAGGGGVVAVWHDVHGHSEVLGENGEEDAHPELPRDYVPNGRCAICDERAGDGDKLCMVCKLRPDRRAERAARAAEREELVAVEEPDDDAWMRSSPWSDEVDDEA